MTERCPQHLAVDAKADLITSEIANTGYSVRIHFENMLRMARAVSSCAPATVRRSLNLSRRTII